MSHPLESPLRSWALFPFFLLALGLPGASSGGPGVSPAQFSNWVTGPLSVVAVLVRAGPPPGGGGEDPAFVWPTEVILAGLFIVILFGFFLLGSAVIHRFHQREVALIEDQLRQIKLVESKLEQRTQELERSNRDLAQFAYVASHDLRAPVRAIKSFAQILEKEYKGKLDADADEYLGFVVGGATRLEFLIDDLLAYSRVDTQGKKFEPVDCCAVFDLVTADLRLDIEQTGAVVTRGVLPTVMADGSQMAQLFQNLLSNAIKFHSQEPPRVHLSVEQRENAWQFAMRDNGIGIDPQHANRIFVMFQRLHTQEEYPGTGMGSAICKKIVERHGGAIWLESQLGQGSTFYFTIPATGDGRLDIKTA